ncbi:MAG TPA: hypothetical protein VED37_13080 [Ktedonobacteraceae bacterium]|nr:hypothetical protein [Ktedonobacteraceae bacterium]
MKKDNYKTTEHKRYCVVPHHYAWMDVEETQEERHEYLSKISEEIKRIT